MTLSIVVPCFNEAHNLPGLVNAFRSAVSNEPGVEVILVDNGSTDQSPAILSDLLQKPGNEFARTVRVFPNQGYGHGIMRGLRAATGEHLGWTHADLQTDPRDVVRGYRELLRATNPGQTVVRGVRQGRPFIDQIFTSGMGLVASTVLGGWLYDINAQPKIFHRHLLEQMCDPPLDFSLDLYFLHLVNRRRLSIIDLPVQCHRRTAGEAKGGGTWHGKLKLIRRTVPFIFELRRRFANIPKLSSTSSNGAG